MVAAVDSSETAAAPLGSFPALFSQALSLGLLSRRRVYHEATNVLKSQQNSLSSLIGECIPEPSLQVALAAGCSAV